MKKVLVTGAGGFMGRNLTLHLQQRGLEVLSIEADSPACLLEQYAGQCDFVIHLAGVNRPPKTEDFMAGNRDATAQILMALQAAGNKAPVLLSSSVQAGLDNPYGESKRAAEALVFAHSERMGSPVLVYRLPNVFGKWCRPNYNSVVATFCHNIARGLPIDVRDPTATLHLVHIDDVVQSFLATLEGNVVKQGSFCLAEPVHTVTLGGLAELLYEFQRCRDTLALPALDNPFVQKLYSTYISYLPPEKAGYFLKANRDQRGAFTEFIRTPDRGQVSVNVAKPGIVKGNHWHHTKHEKFLVVSGCGVIRLKSLDTGNIYTYRVSGDEPQVIEILPGYTHNIQNIGTQDLVTVMWADQPFDPDMPDTFFARV